MRKRIAKKILKNQGLLNYSEQQIKKAQQKLAKLNRAKTDDSNKQA